MSKQPVRRLGRGLSSLISVSDMPLQAEVPPGTGYGQASDGMADAEGRPAPGVRVMELPLDKIVPNPHQPRRHFDETSLGELAGSLKSTGLIQPIIVRQEADTYQLIAGERRWRAAKLADLPTVPAIVRDVDSLTSAQMALVENIQREDLNPVDRALAYQTLLKHLGLNHAELAGRLGQERSSVTHYLRLLELPDPVRDLVRDGKLSLGHAKQLAGLTNPAQQIELAERVVSQSLSVRNLERLIQEPEPLKPAKPTDAPPPPSAHLADLEKTISRQLGMRVQLRSGSKKGKGRLVIHYGSLDQFDQLISRLGVDTE